MDPKPRLFVEDLEQERRDIAAYLAHLDQKIELRRQERLRELLARKPA